MPLSRTRPGEAPRAPGRPRLCAFGRRFFLFSCDDMWALYVIVMMVELYQTLFGISDPRWSCSMMELRGSATLELFRPISLINYVY
jgi:hypothetical protein